MKKDYFNSIEDLPIWNWWKIAETGNLIYLHKDSNYSKVDYSLIDLWNNLQDEYLDEFGITTEFREMLTLKKRWINVKSNFLITGERFLLNEIEEIEIDLKDNANTKVGHKKDETVIMLEQKLNFPLDPKKMSVKKYYNYINYFSKQD